MLFIKTFVAFLDRTRPVSIKENPACIAGKGNPSHHISISLRKPNEITEDEDSTDRQEEIVQVTSSHKEVLFEPANQVGLVQDDGGGHIAKIGVSKQMKNQPNNQEKKKTKTRADRQLRSREIYGERAREQPRRRVELGTVKLALSIPICWRIKKMAAGRRCIQVQEHSEGIKKKPH